MFQYQFSVAVDGRFVFRTEWMDRDEADRARPLLHAAFLSTEGASLSENQRAAGYFTRELY